MRKGHAENGILSQPPRFLMNEICQVHARLLFVLSIVLLVERSGEVFSSFLRDPPPPKKKSQGFD